MDIGLLKDIRHVQAVAYIPSHKSADHTLFLWVGGGLSTEILRAIEARQPPLDKHEELETIFGPDFMKILHYNNDKNDNNFVKRHVIDESIYPDDPLFVVKWKCIAHIPSLKQIKSPDYLYLWSRYDTTNNTFRSIASSSTAKYVEHNANIVFQNISREHPQLNDLTPPETPLITDMEAYTWLLESSHKKEREKEKEKERERERERAIPYIYISNEIEYRDNKKDRIVYRYASPFDARVTIDESFVSYSGEFIMPHKKIIRSNALFGDVPLLYITSAKDVMKEYIETIKGKTDINIARVFNGIVRPYFPEVDNVMLTISPQQTEEFEKKTKIMEDANATVAHVIEFPIEEIKNAIADYTSRVQRLAIKIRCRSLQNTQTAAFRQLDIPLNVKAIFHQLATMHDIPYLEYRDANQKLYKIHKQNLVLNDPLEIEEDDLDEWVSRRSSTNVKSGAYLIARMYFGNIGGTNRFIFININERLGTVDIKYTFGLSHDVTLKSIISSFTRINQFLTSISDIWAIPNFFPILTDTIFTYNRPNTIDIIEFECSMSVSLRNNVCSLLTSKEWLDKQYPFTETPALKDNLLSFKYKRVQNYLNINLIHSIIAKQKALKTDDILIRDLLCQQFVGMTDTEANGFISEATEEFMTQSEAAAQTSAAVSGDTSKSAMYKYQNGVNVNVELLNDITFRIMIKGGLKDITTIDRIFKLISMSFMCSMHNHLRQRSAIERQKKNWEDINNATQSQAVKSIVQGVQWLSMHPPPSLPPLTLPSSFISREMPEEEEKTPHIPSRMSDISEIESIDFEFGYEDVDVDVDKYEPRGSQREEELEELEEEKKEEEEEKEEEEKKSYVPTSTATATSALLAATASSAAPIIIQEIAATSIKTTHKSIILTRLKEFDKELFKGKYTSQCGAENDRQPVVLNKEQKDKIDRLDDEYRKTHPNFKGSYGGVERYVMAGTTQQRKNSNYYVCPEVWCPYSLITMTKEQLEENGGKCYQTASSVDTEKPVILDKYWKGSKSKEHYPVLHDYGNLISQQPCCDKKNPVVMASKKEGDSTNYRYIMRSNVTLDQGRFGMLPESMAVYFHSTNCANQLKDNQDPCYVRKGMKIGPDSFFECMVDLLQNDDIPNVDSLRKAIHDNLTIDEYIKLNNGNIVKTFFDHNAGLHEPENFEKFKTWFTDTSQNQNQNQNQSRYINMFRLRNVRKWLISNTKFTFTGYDSITVAILREYMIYNSFTNFLKYVNSPIPKEGDLFYDLFNRSYPWLNKNGFNIMLFDTSTYTENESASVYVACPSYIASKYVIDLTRPFVMIIKQSAIQYEPICQLSFFKSKMRVKTSYSYFQDPFVRQVASYFENNCKSPMNHAWRTARKVITSLEMHGHHIRDFVIDMSFKFRGVITSKDIFVPFPYPSIVPDLSHMHVTYLDSIAHLSPPANLHDSILELFESLAEETGEKYYNSTQILQNKEGNVLGLFMSDNELVVPFSLGSKYTYFANQDDTTVFIDIPQTMFKESRDMGLMEYPNIIARICRKILVIPEAKKFIRNIRHIDNPIPWSVREDQTLEWLKTSGIINNNIVNDSEIMNMLVQDLTTKDIHRLMNQALEKIRFLDEEIILNHHDIYMGRLKEIRKQLSNPYKHIPNSIEDDYIEYAVLQTLTYDKVTPPNFTDTHSLVPQRWVTLLNRNKNNQEYTILSNSSMTSNDIVLSVFTYVSKMLRKSIRSPEDQKSGFERKGIRKAAMALFLLTNKENAYESNPNEAVENWMVNTSFRRMCNRIHVADIVKKGWPFLYDWFTSENYVYGVQDIIKLAYFVGVNVIIIGRQHPKKLKTGFYHINTNHPHTYLIFHIDHTKDIDVLRPVGFVEDHQIVFDLSDLPTAFKEYIFTGGEGSEDIEDDAE